jgi:hypothetical protein
MMKAINSLNDLAWRLRTPISRLHQIADEIAKDLYSHYTFQTFRDKKSKVRLLRVPRPELKEIQRRICATVLNVVPKSESAHGGIRGRSPHSNARQHLGKAWVVNVDVKNFFPSVRHRFVYQLFRRDLGFGRDVARMLTRITTVDGQLPQGAPTSTGVANLLLAHSVDKYVDAEARQIGAEYTRFLDDMTFSGAEPFRLVDIAAKRLSSRKLRIHRPNRGNPTKSKHKVLRRSVPQEVTGLLVNSLAGPSLSKKRRDGIRAGIFNLRKLGDPEARAKAIRSLRGQISYVRLSNPAASARLMRLLKQAVHLDV